MSLVDQYRQQALMDMTTSDFGSFRRGRFFEAGAPVEGLTGFVVWSSQMRPLGAPLSSLPGVAFGFTPKDAVLRAYFETLERMAASLRSPQSQILGRTYAEITEVNFTPPIEDWCLFADWQYEQPGFVLQRYTRELRQDWTRAEHAWKSGAWLVPTSLAHYCHPEEVQLAKMTSSGMAFSWTKEDAKERALFEVIERDAFLVHWRNAQPGVAVEMKGIEGTELGDFWEKMSAHHDRIQLLLLESPVEAPVICAIYRGRASDVAKFWVSAAAAGDAETAVLKALMELLQGIAGFRMGVVSRTRFSGPLDPKEADEQIRHFEDRVAYFSAPGVSEVADFLFQGDERVSIPRLKEKFGAPRITLNELHNRFRSKGMDVLYVEYESPEVSYLGGHVFRALVPGLIPIEGNHFYRHLGSARLSNRNPSPHPFP